jgi:hypothetical protein
MMKTKNNQSLLPFIALLLFFPIFTVAQEQTETVERREINNQLNNCEMNLAYQDYISTVALEQTQNGGVLIVIARLGDGENSRELIRRRMYNVRFFLEKRGRLAPKKFVVAEGERVKGYGRFEYYLGGKLFEQILFNKNRYICHSCCIPDPSYYPDKTIYERQQKRKQKRKRRG